MDTICFGCGDAARCSLWLCGEKLTDAAGVHLAREEARSLHRSQGPLPGLSKRVDPFLFAESPHRSPGPRTREPRSATGFFGLADEPVGEGNQRTGRDFSSDGHLLTKKARGLFPCLVPDRRAQFLDKVVGFDPSGPCVVL